MNFFIPCTPAAAGVLLLCASLDAAAQQPATTAPTTLMTLGEVVVTARSEPLGVGPLFTSVNILPPERIEHLPLAHNWQVFDQVPGVMLTTFGQGTTSGKFSMRAFNGEGEINAVKLLIDGVPSNSNDGNMPYIDLVPRLDIDAIELVRGTNDPRYGLHNIAGNANIATKIGGNERRARLSTGSFGTRDLQAVLGVDDGSFSQNYAISWFDTDGHRAHAQAEQRSVSGKWFLHGSDRRQQLGLIVRHLNATAQEAGYLTQAQADADPRQSPAHNAWDDGRREVTQVALQGRTAFARDWSGAAQVYLNQLDDRRFVRFSAGASQQERWVGETHMGASGTLSWQAGQTALGALTMSGGVDVEHQDNRSERYTTAQQIRTATTRQQQYDFTTLGGFVQAVLTPTARLTLTPALRVDTISGQYTNQLTGRAYEVNDYGLIRQPKFSALYAVSDTLSVYANTGRSFQVGVGTASYKVNQQNDLAPSVNEGWEAGLILRPLDSFDARLAVWQQTASNEARRKLNDPANDAENIGKTRRQGIDIELNARPLAGLRLWLAGALQRADILKADASAIGTQGRQIDHVPPFIVNAGLDYQPDPRWRYSVSANGQGAYYLERTNSTGRFGDFVLVHALASYRVSQNASIDLQVRNLFDRATEYVWYDGTQSLHSPGPGRALTASLMVRM